MKKSKGIKIYKSKKVRKINKNTRLRSILSIVITIVLLCGLAFLGYSVGAPILDYLKNRDENSSGSSEYIPSDIETTVSDSSASGIDSGSEGSSSGSGQNTEDINNNFTAYKLSVDNMSSMSALQNALESIGNDSGYTSVVIPLKAAGGYLYYASQLEDAVTAGAVKSDITLKEIYNAVTEKGFNPIAQISVLNDNIYPEMYGDTAYRFENEDTLWLDNSPANGGKPWMSAFSAGTKSYLSRITSEIAQAGFKKIVCSDISFPAFRSSDLGYIGPLVESETRYLGLVDIASQIMNTSKSNSSESFIEESAVKIIDGTSEIYKPDELNDVSFAAAVDLTEAGDSITGTSGEISLVQKSNPEKVKIILDELKKRTVNVNIIPVINVGDLTAEELNQVTSMLIDNGYKNYIIK